MSVAILRPYYRRINARYAPVAYLPLSDAAGSSTLADASGSGHTGAVGGAIMGLAIGWAIVAISIITIVLICAVR